MAELSVRFDSEYFQASITIDVGSRCWASHRVGPAIRIRVASGNKEPWIDRAVVTNKDASDPNFVSAVAIEIHRLRRVLVHVPECDGKALKELRLHLDIVRKDILDQGAPLEVEAKPVRSLLGRRPPSERPIRRIGVGGDGAKRSSVAGDGEVDAIARGVLSVQFNACSASYKGAHARTVELHMIDVEARIVDRLEPSPWIANQEAEGIGSVGHVRGRESMNLTTATNLVSADQTLEVSKTLVRIVELGTLRDRKLVLGGAVFCT